MPERTALYRRWRPQTFAAIVGQEHVTRTLRNAIASGQVAHAYLLSGTRGTGKTSIARLVAKAVNCTTSKDGEPCDTCANCVAIREGRFLDLIEIDAASNRGIDEMRDLREKVRFAPSDGRYKVYVIDEAHQLTSEAFNALLKTLEEPPGHVIFVLATTEAQKIPATIVSRTQRFDLRRIPHKAAVDQLAKIAQAEGIQAEPAALEAIARHAQGSLRDAESLLDQIASYADGAVTAAAVGELLGLSDWEETAVLFDALAEDDGAKGVALVGTLIDEGRDLRQYVRRAIEHTRALVLARATNTVPETASEAAAAALRTQAARFTLERLARIAKRLVETEQQLRTGEGTPLSLELAILDLTTGASAPPGATTSATSDRTRPSARPAPQPGGNGPRGGGQGPQSGGQQLRGGAEEVRSGGQEVRGGAEEVRSGGQTARGGGQGARAVVDIATRREQAAARPGPTAVAPTTSATARSGPNSGGPTTSATSHAGAAVAIAPVVSLELVRSAWAELLERTKERSVAKAAQLVKAEPLAIDGATIVIAFSDDFARNVWADRQRPELERDLSAALRTDVRVRCVRQQTPAAPPATDDPMLRAALETFRRPDRILEVD